MPTYAPATCTNCKTRFDRVLVEGDEDGLYAALDARKCPEDGCGKFLCAECPQFHCDGCGKHFCESHLVEYEELKCCPSCAADAVIFNAPDPVCPERERIVEAVTTIAEISVLLRSHETECAVCMCQRKDVVSDRVSLRLADAVCCDMPEVA